MLSRVADAIYWMNRYLERVENYARFLDVNFNLSLEFKKSQEQWMPLVLTTGDWDIFEELNYQTNKTQVIYFLAFDEKNENSIYNSIVKARENARSVRPEITKEVWEEINKLYYLVKEGVSTKVWEQKDPRSFFVQVKKSCQLLYGIFDSTISRVDSWHFGKIGQLIERADKTSRVLDVKYHMLLPSPQTVGTPYDLIQWAALLKSVSAYDMYRRKYGKLTPISISEFLILDTAFPRSILKCISSVELSLHNITGKSNSYSNRAEKEIGKLKAYLEFSDIKEIFSLGLHEYIETIQVNLNVISNAIFDTFFSIENVGVTNNSNQSQIQ
ncbi:MAG: alpha-E domain-containing protein [Saprospiraceae bacterium]